MEMKFVTPELRKLDEIGAEVIVCGLFSDELPPAGTAGLIDWRLGATVCRLIEAGFVTGGAGEALMLPLRPKMPFDKAILYGLGARARFDEALFRDILGRMLRAARGLCARSLVIELPGRHAGAIQPEQATDVLLELAWGEPGAGFDVWTLVEPIEDQKRMTTRMIEQRRRVRRSDGERAD